jgi:hypothetical protein
LLIVPLLLVDAFDANRKKFATAEIVRSASVASFVVVTLEMEFKTAEVEDELSPQKRHGPGTADPAGQSVLGSHAIHEVAPVVFTYVPTSQRVQFVPYPAYEEYVPAAQGVHVEGPEANDPALQGLHSDCPFSET